ncbi:hypothetical protein HU200_035423 [Digitaria exilis]|uniref:Uncharacterized protein n=1 Tax=Digitaria exilis TaxID=1010633 RepID=A0A835BI19_9POAL|nr:hypothetical protein HU200_035423 [Digitaria exilis]
MAADLPEVAMAALYIALGCREVLKPVLEFMDSSAAARGPVVDMAVAAVLLTLPTAYLFVVGVILPIALHVTLPPAAPFSPAAFWQSVALGFVLLLLFVAVPLGPFCSSPPAARRRLAREGMLVSVCVIGSGYSLE